MAETWEEALKDDNKTILCEFFGETDPEVIANEISTFLTSCVKIPGGKINIHWPVLKYLFISFSEHYSKSEIPLHLCQKLADVIQSNGYKAKIQLKMPEWESESR